MKIATSWVKKNKLRKPKINSISEEFKQQNKSCDEFEIYLARLSLEELIALKLEISARTIANNKLYGFPLWHGIVRSAKEALLRFAIDYTTSDVNAARFLGVNTSLFARLRNIYLKDLSKFS